MKGFLAQLPMSGGTRQRKQTGEKKHQGRLPVLTDCHGRSSVHPDQLVALGGECTQPRCHSRYSTAARKAQGKRLTIGEDLTAFHLKLELEPRGQ